MTDDDAAVFKALADPTRRRLLDLLLERGGRTLAELSIPFEPEMTRFGVMKHLRVLVEAGLVAVRPDGRSTRHYLNPVPIREVNRRWMDKYVEQRADTLIDLKRMLEDTPMAQTQLATQLYQVFIRATPEKIWQALTDPEVSKEYFHGARIRADADRMVSHGPDGDVWGDAPVEVFDPPRKLVYGWNSLYDPAMAAEPTSRVSFEIVPDGDHPGVCRLIVVHDRLDGSPLTAESVSGEGWMFVLSNLKSYLETGGALAS
ncbi:MAG: transcriptional regulator, ArsR family [Schumannella sp.]|nr:transcriptional regulator, ArsR family [Schumannella sp.]